MNFTASEDVEVPIDVLFARVTDFPAFERSALRRGAEISRTDSRAELGVGMAWDIKFMLRGKRRQVQSQLVRCDPPNTLHFRSKSDGMTSLFKVELVALSRTRTRLNLDLELTPQSLSARLLVQSLKLARGNLRRRLAKRLAAFARETEEAHRAA